MRFSAAGLAAVTSSVLAVAAAPATMLSIATAPSASAVAGVALATQPVIQLLDASNAPVSQSGVVVTATIASGGGTLGGTNTATTNANGTATFTDLSISGTTGVRTLRFSAPSLPAVTSGRIAVSAGTASKLGVSTQPSSTITSGSILSVQPVVRLLDEWGNSVNQSGVSITATIGSGIGSLGGMVTARTNAAGVATFGNLRITGTGAHTLRFVGIGVTSVTSNSITVNAVGSTPSRLSISTQPSSSVTSGSLLARQPVISVLDQPGALVSSTTSVTASLGTNPGGTLSGITTVSAVNGVATFTNLAISGAAGSYTITFTASGLTGVTSTAVTASAVNASSMPDLAFANFDDGGYGSLVKDGAGSDGRIDIVDDPTGSGRGKVAQFTFAHTGGGTIDINRWVRPASSSTFPTHFFFGGDVYFPSNTAGFNNRAIQRKLIYNRGRTETFRALVIFLWGNQLGYVIQTGTENQRTGVATLTAGVWHRIEYEIQFNSSASASDGVFRLWLDGALVSEQTNIRLYSGGTPTYAEMLGVGYQREGMANGNESAVNEVRYWDRVGFSTVRIPR